MAGFDYGAFDGLGLADLLRRREVTAREVVETALARVDRLNPRLNAVIHRMDERALERAGHARLTGPFAGVPFLFKDLGQLLQGEPFRAGSRFMARYVADHDSELASRFLAAGVIPIGKTNTPELGLTPFTEPAFFGPTLNPWDPGRTAGGSSGGSAAAVASRMVPIASGGDGGGSIRIPASCCGIFGLKPTRGRTPSGPDFGELWHGSVVDHVLSRSVRDSAAMLDAVAGPDPGAPSYPPPPERPFLAEVARAPGRLRIAWTATPFLGSTVHPDCREALADAVRLLTELGHELVEAAPTLDGPGFARAFVTMLCAEIGADIEDCERATGTRATRRGFEPATWALALLGRSLRAPELSSALRFLDRQRRIVGRFFTGFDALLTPTLAVPPFPTGALQPTPRERLALEAAGLVGSGRPLKLMGLLDQLAGQVFQAIPYTPVFNVTGQPAMSVPLWWNAAGLPVGVQLVGRFADESMLFRLAGQLERSRPWADRRPPISE